MRKIKWDGSIPNEAYSLLSQNEGSVIVSPTKVGYIIMATDRKGLDRKFKIKNRKLNKPGVVLCASLDQLNELAELNSEVEALYSSHWNSDILLGCILPWKETGKKYIPDDGSSQLMMDNRGTSCFVIKFGVPSEQVVTKLWAEHKTLVFASSANPSGQGNRGLIEGIGEMIETGVDLSIAANDYVASIQPNESIESRYEQGVMVSMVDEQGALIPLQKGERGIKPCPIVIRKGLDIEKIMMSLSENFLSWDYRQGAYY